jgi:hypothetical protein
MGKILETITPELVRFIQEQPLFFVATAPLAASGHVNLSPKGLDAFRVLSPSRVAYLDLTGSGNETAAHLQENGRVTFMFCSFGNSPLILRLYGRGRVVLPRSPDWPALIGHFAPYPGIRQIIVAEVDLVQTSCGFGVPQMEVVGQRETLIRWAEGKGEQGLREYRVVKNARSLDGMPAPRDDPLAEGD